MNIPTPKQLMVTKMETKIRTVTAALETLKRSNLRKTEEALGTLLIGKATIPKPALEEKVEK